MNSKEMGVFSPCVNLDSISMIKCLHALLSDYPSIKFDSVTTDKKYQGFRVFFTEPEDSVILQKNMLFSDGKPVWIYPLTTHLMILNLDHKKTSLFERDLCCAIEKKFGKVLDIVKTNSTNQSKNWRLEIDVPEFRSLEAFRLTNMKIIIPIRNEEVALQFWCRECKFCGHFQHECVVRDEEEITAAVNLTTEGNSTAEQLKRFRQQDSSSSDQTAERISGLKRESKNISDLLRKTTKKYAEKIGTEVARSFSKENMENNTSVSSRGSTDCNLLTEKDIKKETEELAQSIDAKDDINPRSKKSEIIENDSYVKNQATGKNIDRLSEHSGYPSDVEDDIEFIGYTDSSSAIKSPNASNSSSKAESRNFEEESRSPEAKFNFPSFSFSTVDGQSHESPLAVLTSPRGAEVTTSLSERLQECINQVCTTVDVLDRKKLDAFLIHVKKKSNPIRVALNYTANTKGLKMQLQNILHMYYNTPQTGTKEDIQFIKWLNGLVERYDGSIPKKRKRGGKTDDEPLTKK